MLQLRCIHKTSRRQLHLDKRLPSSIRDRNFSSCLHRPPTTSKALRQPFHHLQDSTSSSPHFYIRHKVSPTIRFASTHAHSLPVADIQPTFSPTTTGEVPGGSSFASFDDIVEDSDVVYDHLGFLKELGLDYGWGPTALIQNLLEHVYIYTGLPWWASLISTILIIRAGMLKLYINASDMSARNTAIKPLMDPLKEKLHEARRNNDRAAMVKTQNEYRALISSAGISRWKSFAPFLQVPLGFGTFRLLKGVGDLPVPGFDVGGILWFQDLTMSDPYGILPLSTGLAYYYSFKLGGDTGTASAVSPAVRKVFLYILPSVTTLFSLFWPAGLQLTIFTTGMLTVFQALAFKQPWLRNFLGMHPLPTPSPTPKQSQSRGAGTRNRPGIATTLATSRPEKRPGIAGAIDTFKEAYADIQKAGEEIARKNQGARPTTRRTGVAASQAKIREQERQREATQRRFEQAQAQGSRNQYGKSKNLKR